MATSEPRNPLYLLLLLISLVFVITALAYAVIPVLEQKALEAGETPPPSPFRDALRNDGWRWLFFEVGAWHWMPGGKVNNLHRRSKKPKETITPAAECPVRSTRG
jgi:hypothetical protein